MPLTIGLTGGIAAGKSEALAAFARLGAATLSSDAVVHELLESEPLRGRLAQRWGTEVVPEGGVDRARIGAIVFADPEELAWLESQIHPLVGDRTVSWLQSLPPHPSAHSHWSGAAHLPCPEQTRSSGAETSKHTGH